MSYEVRVEVGVGCPTAVVAQATTWQEFPQLWGRLLDEVYAVIRAGGAAQAGHNVMLYRDDVPHVEVGVQVAGPFEPVGRVVPSTLPAGAAATTAHRGPYDRLGEAHAAVRGWATAHGHRLTGARWEVYGDWAERPDDLEIQVSWLLA